MSIFPSHRGTRRAIYVIAAAVVGFGLWLGYTYLAQPASRVQSQHFQDNGYFYRMRAAFEVKETGERLDFDYVVACNIRVTRWRDGGLSDDSTYSPRMVAKATAGGQAVVLRTLGACNGLTSENGDIPSDILPLAVWFDTVDDLSRGLGYVSEDAYDSPISKLRFHGARIDRATRGEWERWRKQAAESYIEQGVLPGPWGYDYPESDPNIDRYVSSCQGYSRLKLPENLREKLRSLWPAERPRFWALHSENDNKILALISDPTQPSPPGVGPWRVRFGTPNNTIASGLPTRSGSTVGRAPHIPSRWPTENYPFLWPPVLSAYPIETLQEAAELYAQKLDFRDGAMNGFAACQNRADMQNRSLATVDPSWQGKRHIFVVDNHVVRERTEASLFLLRPVFLQERDEYVFINFSTGL